MDATATKPSGFGLTGSDQAKPGTAEPGHAVGQGAMWIFIIGDLYVFSGWFVFYLIWRYSQHDLFLQAQAHLDQTLGMINTLVLLVSSYLIALCVHEARVGRYKAAVRCAVMTFASGIFFVGSKVYEWLSKIEAGHTFTSNDFFMFYFFLTGIHLFHMLCGFIVLTVLVRNLRTPEIRSQVIVENCAAYWHMVDLLWVAIFALLYLMR